MASGQEEESSPSYQSDEHILCDDCDKLYKGHCPEHGPLEWIKTTRAVESDHYTPSVASLPDGLVLKESGIPDNDMGVFAARLIYKRTMFGPFEGIKVPSTEIPEGRDLTYSWDILQNGLASFVLDGTNEKQSNWMRYVTYARDKREQNLIAFQYQGEIFYRTFRDVYPGEELMIWYEDEYSCSLDDLPQEFPQDQVPEFACQRCQLVFAGATYVYKHNKFRCPEGPLAGTYGARTTGLVGALFRLPVAIANDSWSSPVPNNIEYKPRSDETHHSRRKRKPRKLPRPSETEEAWNPEQPFGPPSIAELNHCETVLNQNETTMVMLPPEAQALDAQPDAITNSSDIDPEESAYENYLKRLSAEDIITDHKEKRPRIDDEICIELDDSKHQYRCNECGKSFARPVWWAKHESGCRKKYGRAKGNTNNNLKTSSSISTPPSFDQSNGMKQGKQKKEPYKCGYCEKRFACPSWMRRHERVHTKHLKTKNVAPATIRLPSDPQDPSHPYTCVDCGRNFAVAAWLTRHRATNHPNSKAQVTKPKFLARGHVCRDCGRSFAVAAWLTRHRMAAHKNNVSKKHVCGVCGRSFAVAFWLTRHLKIHEDSGQKNGATMAATAKPISTVTASGTKKKKKSYNLPWVCGQCGLAFRFESWLSRHQKNNRHTNGYYEKPKEDDLEKLLLCDREGCGKSFKTKRLLGRHRRRHLKKDKENSVTVLPSQAQVKDGPPFICQHSNCGKSYSTKRMLMRHKQKHVQSEESKVVKSEFVQYSPECQVCRKVFSTRDLLDRHIKRIHGKAFLTSANVEDKSLTSDMETNVAKSGTKSAHVCRFCSKVFSYPLLLQRHLKRHKRNEQVQKNLSKALNLSQEPTVLRNHKQNYVCEVCSASFKGLHLLNKHLEKHLGEDSSSKQKTAATPVKVDSRHPYKCDQCERTFAAAFWLTRHKNEHKKKEEESETKIPKSVDPKHPFQCDECGRSFAVAFWLTRHKREHDNPLYSEKEIPDIKPVPVVKGKSKVYVCDICDREFIWPSWLVKHRKVHRKKFTEVKKVEHPVKEKGKPLKKEKTVNKATPVNYEGVKASKCFEMFEENGVKQYRCTICGKATVWHTGIVYHIRVHHTHEKPFKCRVCGKDFHMAGDLTKHARRHSGEKPYYCQHCKKRFTTSQQARKHAAVHSSELPFHCKHCGKRYRDRSSVWRHLAKKSCPESQGLTPTNHKVVSESSVDKSSATSKKKQVEDSKSSRRPRTQKKKLAQVITLDQRDKNVGTNKTLIKTKKISYDCKNCNRSFSQLDAFKAHIESYNKAGHIVCEYCGKCWARTADLTRHLRVHTGERPYVCPDCGLGFKVSDALKRHMGKLHPKSTKSIIRIKSEPQKTKVDYNLLHDNIESKRKKKSSNAFEKSSSGVWNTPGRRKRAQVKLTDDGLVSTSAKDQGLSQKSTSEDISSSSVSVERAQTKLADEILVNNYAENVDEHSESGALKEGSGIGKVAQPKQADDVLVNNSEYLQNVSDILLSGTTNTSDGRNPAQAGRVNELISHAEHDDDFDKQTSEGNLKTSDGRKRAQMQPALGHLTTHPEEHREEFLEEPPIIKDAEASTGKIVEQEGKGVDDQTSQKILSTPVNPEVVEKGKGEELENRRPVTKKKRPAKHSGSTKGRKCEFCGKVFSAAGNLARHVRLHTGEKPFECKVCGKSFMRTDILSQHIFKCHA